MWKVIKIGVIVLLGAFVTVLIYAATLPNHFTVSRSATVQAPPEKIYPLIDDLRSMNQWSPFANQDPNIKIIYGDHSSGKGASFNWDGSGRFGKGSMEITDAAAPSFVRMNLNMVKPMAANNSIVFNLQPVNDGTDVTWTMSGDYPYLNRVLGVVFSMDRVVGGEFETGLNNLKQLAEKGTPQQNGYSTKRYRAAILKTQMIERTTFRQVSK